MKTYISTIILALLILSACKKAETPMERSTPESSDTIEAIVSTEEEDAPETDGSRIYASGSIDVPPNNKVSVSPYFEGYVKEIRVLPGDQVEKEQVLFALENPEYLVIQESYAASKAQMEYLRDDYQRQQALASESIASQKQFKKAESDYLVMNARYTALREKIEMMGLSLEQVEAGTFSNTILVRAPISGSVTDVMIERSSFVEATDDALGIVNTEHIHLELEVFERDVVSLKEGQQLSFRISGIPNRSYEGSVYLISNSIDPQSRTAIVHGHITDEAATRFIPGMFVEAEILVE
jgi:cobalt-zinc-cadmium efflux system membrane fusion protein